MTPRSQKAADRPISFYLFNRLTGAVLLPPMNLIIRPEDLTRGEPSRLQVMQTLGGAWADAWGVGISMLTIAGHTGWRGSIDKDGAELFAELREQAYKAWHRLRAEARAAGTDPDAVELIFTDALDSISVVVAPMSFQLRRNRARPLLMQYSIQLLILRDVELPMVVLDPLTVNNPRAPTQQVSEAAAESLSSTIAEQSDLANTVARTFAPAALVVRDLVESSARLLEGVQVYVAAAGQVIDAVTAPVIFVAAAFQQAARNLAWAMTGPLGVTQQTKGTLMQIAGSFSDGYCNLKLNFPQVGTLLDLSDLYGASNCSSTAGGNPITAFQGENPFLSLYDGRSSPALVSEAGMAAIAACSTDPLELEQRPQAELLSLAADLAAAVQA